MNEALYQQAIMDLAKDEAHAGQLDGPDATATLDNPLCGDRVTIDVKLSEGKTVSEIAHSVKGCLLCKASATLMSRQAQGANRQDVENLKMSLEKLLSGHVEPGGEISVFTLVRAHKSRHDCLRLPIDTLLEALKA